MVEVYRKEFAKVYDSYMAHVPYDTYAEYTLEVKKNIPLHIFDLGCGSCIFGTALFKERKQSYGDDASPIAYSGIDLSSAMIDVGKEKGFNNINVQAIQDFNPLELAEAIPSIHIVTLYFDTLHYLTRDDFKVLVQKLQAYAQYKKQSLYFMFDIHTKEGVQSYDHYYSKEKIDEYEVALHSRIQREEHTLLKEEDVWNLEIFIDVFRGTDNVLSETHHHRIAPVEEYINILEACGTIQIEVADDVIDTRVFVRTLII